MVEVLDSWTKLQWSKGETEIEIYKPTKGPFSFNLMCNFLFCKVFNFTRSAKITAWPIVQNITFLWGYTAFNYWEKYIRAWNLKFATTEFHAELLLATMARIVYKAVGL